MEESGVNSSLVKLSNFNTALITVEEQDRLLDIIKTLSNGKGLKVENHADALALCIKAKELNLPMGTALDHCFIVNGKVGIDVHIAKAKLLSSGTITWERLEDYKPIYKYSDGNMIFNGIDELPENYVILSRLSGNEEIVNKLRLEGKFPVAMLAKEGKPIIHDRVTTYKFSRQLLTVGGKYKEIVEISSFSEMDAIIAGLITDTTSPSSPWIRYRKRMIDHRAFMNGARAIADDILLGMYSVPELLDSSNIATYDLLEDGTVTILK